MISFHSMLDECLMKYNVTNREKYNAIKSTAFKSLGTNHFLGKNMGEKTKFVLNIY